MSWSEDVLNQALNLYSQKNKWTFISGEKDVKLYSQDRPEICNFPCYLIESTFNKSKEDMVNKIWIMDEIRAKEYDPSISMWKVVESGDNYKICSQYTTMPWPLYPRHLIYAQYKIDKDNNTYIVSFTIKHPKVHVDHDSHVESIVHMSVYGYEKVSENVTNVWRMLHVDPQGNIPASLVNLYSKNNLNMFLSWK